MSDPRITPDPARVTFQKKMQVGAPVVDLRRAPDGPRDRQLIYGDTVIHLADIDGRAYVQSDKDNYCGYVEHNHLTICQDQSHWVSAPATHLYTAPNLKSAELGSLSFGSTVAVSQITQGFGETPGGYIPHMHLSPLPAQSTDPATIAALFNGTPYLWGGNSRWGIDCSGLIQAALLACAIPCPGDSDQQMSLGDPTTAPYRRNDLLFWKGHVALVTDESTMIHANAHTMMVNYEPIDAAISRIASKGDGPVTAHRRLPPLFG